MKIREWFTNLASGIRSFFARIGAFLLSLWPHRRNSNEDATVHNSGTETDATAVAPIAADIPRRRGWLARLWGRLRQIFSPVSHWAGKIWRLFEPIPVRIFQQGAQQSGLLIRKIGVKQRYRYSLNANPLHQLLTDGANALAVVVGLGSWPYLQAWSAQVLPSLLAPHYWILSAIVCLLPLFVVYLRWQEARQRECASNWDILTIVTGWIGVFGVLFTGTLMIGAFIDATFLVVPLIWVAIATVAWLLGESVNAYTILIRRPYTAATLLMLSKNLLFVLSGWLILVYLPVVQLIDWIQLESATFLLTILRVAALLALLLSLIHYILQRLNVTLPTFTSPLFGQRS